jgi:hypothetical protein
MACSKSHGFGPQPLVILPLCLVNQASLIAAEALRPLALMVANARSLSSSVRNVIVAMAHGVRLFVLRNV